MDVLMYGDTVRAPALRHELPVAIFDPLAYAEVGGTPYVIASQLEVHDVERVRPDAEFVDVTTLGADEVYGSGMSYEDVQSELLLRGCRHIGLTAAAVPGTFPLGPADHLRANGIELSPDPVPFSARRRAKNGEELAGIRRACRAAEAGAAAIALALRDAEPGDDGALHDAAGPITCEGLRAAAIGAAGEEGATLDIAIVARGAQAALGHDIGSGPLHAGEVLVVDLAPQDRESTCFADFTRTFVAGGAPDEEIVGWHNLCRNALQRVLDSTAAGVVARELWEVACDVFEAAGEPTQRTKQPDEILDHGFYHALGHGVGLEVHEEPGLGRAGHELLVPGDVIAIEPGLYRPGFGGVRIEDLVLVTDDGFELLTDFPYDLRV